jgi:SAM-dependent methyltransferase
MEFFIYNIKIEGFKGKRILEVGSKYVNGSVRPLIEKFANPKEYIGVDIEPGKYVDIMLPAEKLVEHFGEEAFDIVISTELLEHVKDWRLAIINMKRVLKRGGYVYITTRLYSFPYHAYPYDFWRYEAEDMRKIFSDFEILKLIRDHEAPGVFLKARKPESYNPADLSSITLYSMILGKRIVSIPSIRDMPIFRRLKFIELENLVKLGKFLIYQAK